MSNSTLSSPTSLVVLEADKLVREFVIKRPDGYARRATWHRRYFRASGILVIALSATIPLLASLHYASKTFVVALASVIIAALTGLRNFYRWDHLWTVVRQAAFDIDYLLNTYELDRAAIAARAMPETDRDEAVRDRTQKLLEAVEKVRQAESRGYFGSLQFPHGR